MIVHMFSVHDAASQTYSRPFYARAVGEALRNFIAECNDAKSVINANAKDFTLFRVGEFEDTSGVITPLKVHEPLGKAIDFKEAGSPAVHS